VALIAALFVGVAGCDAGNGTSSTSAPSPSPSPNDPLADQDNDLVGDEPGEPLVHQTGQEPTTVTIERPEGAQAVRFIVTCVPESYFTVTMGVWYSGYCGESIRHSGDLPFEPETAVGEQLEVTLDISPGVTYWLLGLPVE
jgi:hypothetical protein